MTHLANLRVKCLPVIRQNDRAVDIINIYVVGFLLRIDSTQTWRFEVLILSTARKNTDVLRLGIGSSLSALCEESLHQKEKGHALKTFD